MKTWDDRMSVILDKRVAKLKERCVKNISFEELYTIILKDIQEEYTMDCLIEDVINRMEYKDDIRKITHKDFIIVE